MADFSALTVTIESAALAEAIDLREKVRGLEAELSEAQAEIDALTQTNALMLDSAERGQATVAELRAEVATLTAELLQKEQQLAAARAERDECARSWAMSQQQLAEARDTIAANNAKSEAWEAEAEAQLAEARAEVERLRPAAEAWELQRKYAKMFGDNLRGRVSDVDLACLEAEYEAAAARARAREARS